MSAVRPAEADLQAYVDARLDAARRAALERWLAAHPDDAACVAAYRLLGERCRAAYAPVLEEPIPLALLAALRGKPSRRLHIWQAAAAVAAAALVTIAVSLYLAPAPPPEIVHRAAMAHAVYASEVQHPVEARAKGDLLAWLSERLGMPLRPPHLERAGYAFIGGRLLPGDKAPAALLMYEGQNGQRITMYLGPEFREEEETALRYANGAGGTRVYYWLDDECGYAVASADLSQKELLVVALMVHEQLEK